MIRPGKHQARRTGRDCPCPASLAQIRADPCHTANMEIDLYKRSKENYCQSLILLEHKHEHAPGY